MGFRHTQSWLNEHIMGAKIVESITVNPGEPEASQTWAPRSIGYDSTAVPLHPLGVKPAGNAYATNENTKSAAGLFATLPDELLVQILELLDAKTLLRIGCACKAIYAFSRLEDLWKTLCIE